MDNILDDKMVLPEAIDFVLSVILAIYSGGKSAISGVKGPSSGGKGSFSGGKGSFSGVKEPNSGGLESSSGGKEKEKLNKIANIVASTKKISKTKMIETILQLCDITSLKADDLEKLLDRSGEFLRKDYLTPLVKEKKLRLLYPTKPNHQNQAYISVEKT